MNYQDILAKCFIIMSEVDYELREWQDCFYGRGKHGRDSVWVEANTGNVTGGLTTGLTKAQS